MLDFKVQHALHYKKQTKGMSMKRPITKETALKLYDGNGAALARALGITRAAVSEWPLNQPIPEKHELKLVYELKPDVFGSQSNAA